MADGVNIVLLLGNVGTAPELRETSLGKSVCNFRMVTNSRHGKGRYKREATEQHQVTVWGREAERCAEHLGVGSYIHVSGYLQTRKWEDRNGRERVTTEIVAEEVLFLKNKER